MKRRRSPYARPARLGGVLEAPAAIAEEHLGLVEALEVILDGALRAVLGSQVALG
jgi:hypothetical protein